MSTKDQPQQAHVIPFDEESARSLLSPLAVSH